MYHIDPYVDSFPASEFLVMWKSSTANTNWTIADNTRDTSNPITKRLIPNLNNAEDSSVSVDFNNTGFEFNSGQANDSGETFGFKILFPNP